MPLTGLPGLNSAWPLVWLWTCVLRSRHHWARLAVLPRRSAVVRVQGAAVCGAWASESRRAQLPHGIEKCEQQGTLCLK